LRHWAGILYGQPVFGRFLIWRSVADEKNSGD
jgi:hypothetical protein